MRLFARFLPLLSSHTANLPAVCCHVALLLFAASHAQAAQVKYTVEVQALVPARGGDYYSDLLTLILNASKSPDERIEFRFSDHQFAQARWIAEVQRQSGNQVLWTMADKEREQLLRPIRVPLFKGLLGRRVLVIRNQDAKKFAAITTVDQLRKLVAGQGAHWPDTDILLANGFRVTESANKDSLYKMLAAHRFDFFPRGIAEIDTEKDLIEENHLMVEPGLLLSYPAPMYFFVNKKNSELAERLEKGWAIIIANGAFDRFFYSHPRVLAAMRQLTANKHRVIRLDNPNLSPETPLGDARYWIDDALF